MATDKSEDDDYMSDAFLNPCNNDVRPGLINNRSKQRELQIIKQKRENDSKNRKVNVPTRVLEAERLTQGLEQAIGPENKGFAMLQKMGFQPGRSLGASGTSGIKEPVGINVKTDRKGLGRDEAIKEIQRRKQQLRSRKQNKELDVNEYRAALSSKYRERDIKSDLYKSEKSCYMLDTENGIDVPDEIWFWPEHCRPEPEEDEEEEEDNEYQGDFQPAEKLELLTVYLRQSYCYCIWCGVQYEDEKDLSDGCPGPSREEH